MILAVDPGKTGAICAYKSKDRFKIFDTPTTPKQIIEFCSNLNGYEQWYPSFVSHIYSEKPFPMIGEGRQSMLSYGETYGIVKGILISLHEGSEFVEIHPRSWKSFFKVKAEKKESLRWLEAMGYDTSQLFGPRGGFKDGRCDALMIAIYADAIVSGKLLLKKRSGK